MQNLQNQIDQVRDNVMPLTEAVADLQSSCRHMRKDASVTESQVVTQDEVLRAMESDEALLLVQQPAPKLEKRPKMCISSSGVIRPDETGQM